jgi:hypothetical protein
MYTELTRFPLYKPSQRTEFFTHPIIADNDYTFSVASASVRLDFIDENLTLEENGDFIIQLAPLHFERELPNEPIPKIATVPAAVLKERAYRRRLVYLSKDAIEILDKDDNKLYFYLQDNNLVIKKYGLDAEGKLKADTSEAEIICDKIEIKHATKCVNVEKLDLGHSYFPLSDEILRIWEPILEEKSLKSVYLIHTGTNCLNGKDYYRFSIDLPQKTLDFLENVVEYVEDIEGYSGYMTSQPYTVADALKIQIKEKENK